MTTMKHMISTTCLVVPLAIAGAAQADQHSKILDPDKYQDKYGYQQLLFENEDVPFSDAADPIEIVSVDPPEDRFQCTIELPDKTELLFGSGYMNNPKINNPGEENPHGPNAVAYDVVNPEPLNIKFKNIRWARALMVEFSPFVLNYRNADSYENAAESDRRILPLATPTAIYAPPIHKPTVSRPDNEPNHWIHYAKSPDSDSENRVVLRPKGREFGSSTVTYTVPELDYRVALSFQSWNPSSPKPEDFKEVLFWEDSTYEIVINAFCLDEGYNRLADPGLESDLPIAPRETDT